MKGVVMSSFYRFWLALDKWTFKQAALIFNGHDPRKFETKVNFDTDIYDIESNCHEEWEADTVKTYWIFIKANWQLYGGGLYGKNAMRYQFFELARDKKITLPKELAATLEDLQMSDELGYLEDDSTKSFSIQQKRELVLAGWLVGADLNDSEQLEHTQEDLWKLLNKASSGLFKPASDGTIKDFFKAQNLCRFKIGRRKGG
jgi:hypothetical protein